jgi:cytochrome P450
MTSTPTSTSTSTPTVHLAERAEVEAALADPALVPPGAPPSIGAGATADLRAAMARFGAGAAHHERRTAVVAAVEAPDPARLRAAAVARTRPRLTGARIEALADVGHRVPVPTLVEALGALDADDGADADRLTDDVRRVAEVIGRGAPSSAASDRAAARLLDRFAAHPAGAVPVVSVLYQAHDATAALLAATLVSRHGGIPRRSAIAGTLRTAVADTVVGGTPIAAGTVVALDLDASGLERGSGPHRCPGFDLAEALVAGMVDALGERGYELLPDEVVLTGGRPTAVPMRPRP